MGLTEQEVLPVTSSAWEQQNAFAYANCISATKIWSDDCITARSFPLEIIPQHR